MDFRHYQIEAAKTDQVSQGDDKSKLVPLLGLAGEVGSLLSEYKKFLRDGGAHEKFEVQFAEDLGDLLWYIANVATKFGIDLNEVAQSNLDKVRLRWPKAKNDSQPNLFDSNEPPLFDEQFPIAEQIPRTFEVNFKEVCECDSIKVLISRDGVQIGDALTDNAPDDDGYRFHDVFHLSYAALLGWSPITRKLLKVKRKSVGKADEVEDGARARIIEELISQLVFQYSREHNFLDGIETLDYHLLKTIHSLVQDREVKGRALFEWERAILAGYRVWRRVYANRGGTVKLDLIKRTIEYSESKNQSSSMPIAEGCRRCSPDGAAARNASHDGC